MQQFRDRLVGAFQNRDPYNLNANVSVVHVASFKDFKTIGPPKF